MSVPLFDSLAHPLLHGTWSGLDASFSTLSAQLRAANVARACAVGMPSIGGYRHDEFAAACASDPRLVPVAGVDPAELDRAPNLIRDLRELGFRAVKLHPRLVR